MFECTQCGRQPPRLVTVSKTQPVKKIGWAYSHGLRHFGENYVSGVSASREQQRVAESNREVLFLLLPRMSEYHGREGGGGALYHLEG